MEQSEIAKFKLTLKFGSTDEIHEIFKEIIDRGEFPAELVTVLIERIKDGAILGSLYLGKLIALAHNETLFDLCHTSNRLHRNEYVEILKSGYKADVIEEILEADLYKIYKDDTDPWRSEIAKAIRDGGTRRSLAVIEFILNDLTDSYRLDKMKLDSGAYEIDGVSSDVFFVLKLKSRAEYINLLKEVKKAVEERELYKDILNQAINPVYNCIKLSDDVDNYLEIIRGGESKRVEFKSTFRYCVHTQKKSDDVLQESLKTLVAFLNSEGGYLFVGVNDNGEIIGLDDDFACSGKNKDQDSFLKSVDDLISSYINASALAGNISIIIPEIDGKKIAVFDVKERHTGPAFLRDKGKKNDSLFVRRTASSIALSASEQQDYIKEKWG